MNLKFYLDKAISQALCELSGEPDCQALIQYAKSPQFGDYQANGVMALAKRLGRNPRELAQQLVEQLDLGDIADKVEVAGPGFINIFISRDYLGQRSAELTIDKLIEKTAEPQRIIVDYSSPNLAKEMHVGHLRGTIIGDALARCLEYLGHDVIRHNHFGDWGTQFGMLITHMRDQEQAGESLSSELSDLEGFYRAAKQRFDADEAFANRARENVVRLQSGDEACLALWRRFIAVSIEHCQALYEQLDITLDNNDIVPESFYNERLAGIIEALASSGLLSEDQGAQCVFLDEFIGKDDKPLPVIVRKRDGGYLYATTDLAALNYRSKELAAKRILYVVDARQSLHFQQVFAVARQAGLVDPDCSLEHISYGTMMGRDGKPFKTRSGDTVKLSALVDEGIDRARRIVEGKNPALAETQKLAIAEAVGIGAIKYADLSKNRNSDYIFDWDSMLSFDGNTAPYLLYAYARIRSIFRRHEGELANVNILIDAPEERALALKLLQFHETIEQLARDCLPNQLCHYLHELAGTFMTFYEACPVLKAEQEEQRNSRLRLCELSAATLGQGLQLLGITALEQM